jgi:threonine synthase
VLIKLKERGVIAPRERVVVISTAHGLKFAEFKVGYHQASLPDVTPRYANPPVDLPADVDAVRRAIDERVEALVQE